MRLAAVSLLIASALATAVSIDARPSEPESRAATGSPGCGTSHWFNGITQYHSVDVPTSANQTESRSYSIHLPSSYDAKKPYPVVLGFHGSSSIGLFFELDTGLSGGKYSNGTIMVYPSGLGGAWAGANYSTASIPQDLAFISTLLDELRNGWCVDDSRIYATGMSIGAGFVNTLACSPVGDNFAAFAMGSGSFYTDNGTPTASCTPARTPLPILEIHGGSDTDVPYAGGQGEGGVEPAIPNWLATWTARNCPTAQLTNTTETLFAGDVHHTTWSCGAATGVVEHWKVDDMRHCWASTTLDFSQIAAGQGPTPIDGSTLVMGFFARWVKP
ncbi:carbohydrate esterase family 1 protein [Favolaschia claudopus]|uniref:feruloyl esterase n=1 Tax=Favolaschia claudopus TaxID=2862362 RepID=A0AAV9ZI33_9AGAR